MNRRRRWPTGSNSLHENELQDATSSTVTFTTRPLPEGGTLKNIVPGDDDPDDGNET